MNKCKYKLNSYHCNHEEDAHLPKRISWKLHQVTFTEKFAEGDWVRTEMPMMAQCTKCKSSWPNVGSQMYHDFEG